MAQIPISGNTYARLSILKAKSILAKDGSTVTWDSIISTMIDVCNMNSDDFLEAIKMTKGKSRTIEELKGDIVDGKKVTSEDLKSHMRPQVFKE